MNRKQKVAHLRGLADAIESGEEIFYEGEGITVDSDGVPTLAWAPVWSYDTAPVPWEAYLVIDSNDPEIYVTYPDGGMARRAIENTLDSSIEWVIKKIGIVDEINDIKKKETP